MDRETACAGVRGQWSSQGCSVKTSRSREMDSEVSGFGPQGRRQPDLGELKAVWALARAQGPS